MLRRAGRRARHAAATPLSQAPQQHLYSALCTWRVSGPRMSLCLAAAWTGQGPAAAAAAEQLLLVAVRSAAAAAGNLRQ
jgi:hypothetical protein